MKTRERVIILHDDYPGTMFISRLFNNRFIYKQTPDNFDNYIQSRLIKNSLKGTNYKTVSKPFNSRLKIGKNDTVFNIVESVDGRGDLLYRAPEVLEEMGIPFTGGNSQVIKTTTDKVATKEILKNFSLPTPNWITKDNSEGFIPERYYIIKPVSEDASIGISGESVLFFRTLKDLKRKLTELETGSLSYFAELYIDGREFNISLINSGGSPKVLPPAELVFKNSDPDKFNIACYSAKWDENSPEYMNSVRSFDFSPLDQELIKELKDISCRCWDIFSLKGWARVDFRVDRDGNPYILEINSNPCIALDSGFTAAAFKSGLNYRDILENILSDLNGDRKRCL